MTDFMLSGNPRYLADALANGKAHDLLRVGRAVRKALGVESLTLPGRMVAAFLVNSSTPLTDEELSVISTAIVDELTDLGIHRDMAECTHLFSDRCPIGEHNEAEVVR